MLFLLFYFVNLKIINKKNTINCYNGFDMRENIKNDSDIDKIIYIKNIFYKKKILDNLLSNSMNINQKINLIELNKDTNLKINISNGNLFKDWNFDFYI